MPEPRPATEAGTLFQRCSAVFGEVHVMADRPRITDYRNVILLGHVLYDDRRQLVSDSAFFRGVPHMHTPDVPQTTRVPARAADRLPDGRYFWLGLFHVHFGHFIISTLSRLWALAELDVRSFTFLYAGGAPPGELFRLEFVRDVLTALGIGESQLRQVGGALFIPRITVVEPGLVENYGLSRAYVDMLGRIRSALLPAGAPDGELAGPAYITKERLTGGVRGIVNENEVTAILARAGARVVSPETLTFRDQLAFWSAGRSFAGFASSAFHMAAFVGGRGLCTISHDHLASCNQVMLDLLSGNRHLHLHAGPHVTSLGPDHRFTDVMRIVDPAAFARDMLQLLERLGNLPGQTLAPEPRSCWPDAVGYEPFGTELARAGRASQSSVYEIDEGHNRTADGALSGRLSGLYQTSTRCEDQPWWQVELAQLSRIYEVRVYNRCEVPLVQERLAGFILSASLNGTDWSTLHVHEGPAPGPEPFRWQAQATTLVRFIRISLPTKTWLHLDQVEVFGEGA